MRQSRVCVPDANVLIDLKAGGIVPHAFRLDVVWRAVDIVVEEELAPDGPDFWRGQGLRVDSLPGAQLRRVQPLQAAYPRLSVADIYCLLLAQRLGATLVTGDKDLRRAAEHAGADVHGTLWLLDQLVAESILADREAIIALQRMLQARRRLPLAECDQRLRAWRG